MSSENTKEERAHARAYFGAMYQAQAYLRDIKVLHTLFSLPFLVVSVLMAQNMLQTTLQGMPPENIILLTRWQAVALVVALLCARSYAMGMNRWLDRAIDSQNPRTRQRMIPSGQLRKGYSILFVVLSALGFVLTSLVLRPELWWPAIVVLCFLGGYSWMKRLHWSTHFYLGGVIGSLPIAVMAALNLPVSPAVWCLGAGMALWIAGFDILYALADAGFDQEQGLKSLPVRLGVRRAVWISGVCYGLVLLSWGYGGYLYGAGYRFMIGLAVIGGVFVWQLLSSKEELPRRVLEVNAWLGVVYLVFFYWDHVAR